MKEYLGGIIFLLVLVGVIMFLISAYDDDNKFYEEHGYRMYDKVCAVSCEKSNYTFVRYDTSGTFSSNECWCNYNGEPKQIW